MALKSIEKKKAEIDAARREIMFGRSKGKNVLIRVRVGLLVGGIMLLAAELALAILSGERQSEYAPTCMAYIGVGMLIAWSVVLLAGMFVE